MFRKLVFSLLLCQLAFAQTGPADALTKAHELYLQHKYADAAAVLKTAIKKFPDCTNCYLELAGVSIRLRDGSAAFKALDKALETASTNEQRAVAHMFRGTLLYSGDKKELQQAEKDFRDALAAYPDATEGHLKLGITLIREMREQEGITELRHYIDAAGPKDSEAYARKILANPRVARDVLAPEFSVVTSDGQNFSLAGCAGKIVVIDFWATWCPPCRESVSEIKELVKKYPADKLVVLSASADRDEQTWRTFIAKKEMTWPQFFDKERHLAEMFAVEGYPTYVVIDRDGFIRKRIVGMNPTETISHKLRDELKSILE
jgi:thiol-disulfide isomerase/thioredoxin